jgi:microcystin degradation protein MlrC
MSGSDWPRSSRGRTAPRVALGGLAHETNTFNPVATGLGAFRERALLQGEGLIAQARGARNALGGIVAAAAAAGVELVPTLFASAMPGGTVTADAHRCLREALLDRLRTAARGPWPPGGLAGAILVLHGAMVAEDEADVEGALLRDVRALLGPRVPIVVVIDSHANVTPVLVAQADLVLSYATYPHVDTFETGERALDRLLELGGGRLRPTTALRQVPLLAPLPPQRTDGATPMAEVLAHAAELGRRREVVEVAVCGGFPYADVERAGLSLRVTTDAAPALAEELADRLASVAWDRRERFAVVLPEPRQAIDRALALGDGAKSPVAGPVVLAETADNPGAGAPGDGTRLLTALLERRVEGSTVATIADPDAVAAAAAAGVGAVVTVPVGGRAHPLGGEPVVRAWEVRAVGDGTFQNRGPIGAGRPTRLGRTAVLAADGIEVVVSERRVQALEPELLRSVGIEPRCRRLLALKSSVHFRAAFAGLAAAVVEVGGPGLSGSDLAAFPYRSVRRPIAPIDREVRYLD